MPEPASDRWSHPAAILVATDIGDLDRLLPFAFEQAAETGARLILLHVIALSEALTADIAGMPYYDPAGALDTAARALESACQHARKQGLAATPWFAKAMPPNRFSRPPGNFTQTASFLEPGAVAR